MPTQTATATTTFFFGENSIHPNNSIRRPIKKKDTSYLSGARIPGHLHQLHACGTPDDAVVHQQDVLSHELRPSKDRQEHKYTRVRVGPSVEKGSRFSLTETERIGNTRENLCLGGGRGRTKLWHDGFFSAILRAHPTNRIQPLCAPSRDLHKCLGVRHIVCEPDNK